MTCSAAACESRQMLKVLCPVIADKMRMHTTFCETVERFQNPVQKLEIWHSSTCDRKTGRRKGGWTTSRACAKHRVFAVLWQQSRVHHLLWLRALTVSRNDKLHNVSIAVHNLLTHTSGTSATRRMYSGRRHGAASAGPL